MNIKMTSSMLLLIILIVQPAIAQMSNEVSKTYTFDTIVSGQVISFNHNIRNTYNKPLVITNVQTSCGCLTASWEIQTTANTDSLTVNFAFNTSGKFGYQTKKAQIFFNDETTQLVNFNGYVSDGMQIRIEQTVQKLKRNKTKYRFEVHNVGDRSVDINQLAVSLAGLEPAMATSIISYSTKKRLPSGEKGEIILQIEKGIYDKFPKGERMVSQVRFLNIKTGEERIIDLSLEK